MRPTETEVPIYEYECRKCGVFELSQSISEEALSRCPKCRSKVSRLISAPAFHLKGGGWYADGYDSKASKNKEKKESSKDGASAKTDTAKSEKAAETPKSSTSS